MDSANLMNKGKGRHEKDNACCLHRQQPSFHEQGQKQCQGEDARSGASRRASTRQGPQVQIAKRCYQRAAVDSANLMNKGKGRHEKDNACCLHRQQPSFHEQGQKQCQGEDARSGASRRASTRQGPQVQIAKRCYQRAAVDSANLMNKGKGRHEKDNACCLHRQQPSFHEQGQKQCQGEDARSGISRRASTRQGPQVQIAKRCYQRAAVDSANLMNKGKGRHEKDNACCLHRQQPSFHEQGQKQCQGEDARSGASRRAQKGKSPGNQAHFDK